MIVPSAIWSVSMSLTAAISWVSAVTIFGSSVRVGLADDGEGRIDVGCHGPTVASKPIEP